MRFILQDKKRQTQSFEIADSDLVNALTQLWSAGLDMDETLSESDMQAELADIYKGHKGQSSFMHRGHIDGVPMGLKFEGHWQGKTFKAESVTLYQAMYTKGVDRDASAAVRVLESLQAGARPHIRSKVAAVASSPLAMDATVDPLLRIESVARVNKLELKGASAIPGGFVLVDAPKAQPKPEKSTVKIVDTSKARESFHQAFGKGENPTLVLPKPSMARRVLNGLGSAGSAFGRGVLTSLGLLQRSFGWTYSKVKPLLPHAAVAGSAYGLTEHQDQILSRLPQQAASSISSALADASTTLTEHGLEQSYITPANVAGVVATLTLAADGANRLHRSYQHRSYKAKSDADIERLSSRQVDAFNDGVESSKGVLKAAGAFFHYAGYRHPNAFAAGKAAAQADDQELIKRVNKKI